MIQEEIGKSNINKLKYCSLLGNAFQATSKEYENQNRYIEIYNSTNALFEELKNQSNK